MLLNKYISVVLKEKVISFKGSRDGTVTFSNEAERPPQYGSIPLFPNATKNKMYYIEVKIQYETEVGATNKDSLSLQVLDANNVVVRCGLSVCPVVCSIVCLFNCLYGCFLVSVVWLLFYKYHYGGIRCFFLPIYQLALFTNANSPFFGSF